MEFSRSSHRSLIKKVQLTKSLPEPVRAIRKDYKYISAHLDSKLIEALRSFEAESGLTITDITRAAVSHAMLMDMLLKSIGSREAVKHNYGSVTYYRLTVAFTAEQKKYLKDAAQSSNLPLTEIIRRCLRFYLEKKA